MTVQADFTPVQVTLTTGTDVITVPNYVLLESELKVIRTRSGVNTTLTLNSHYTVTGEGDEGGCTVTMIGQTAGDTITIYRNMGFLQENDLLDGEKRSGPETEKVYDRLTMQDQQLKEQFNRCIRLPEGEDPGNSGELPDADSRKGKVLTFDPTDGLPTATDFDDIVVITGPAREYGTVAAMQADSTVSALGTGQSVLLKGYYGAGDFGVPVPLIIEASTGGVKSFLLADTRYANLYCDGPVNVKWFGAKGDSTHTPDFTNANLAFGQPYVGPDGTDDTQAFVDAFAASDHVYVPKSTGWYRIKAGIAGTAQVQIPDGGSLKGEGEIVIDTRYDEMNFSGGSPASGNMSMGIDYAGNCHVSGLTFDGGGQYTPIDVVSNIEAIYFRIFGPQGVSNTIQTTALFTENRFYNMTGNAITGATGSNGLHSCRAIGNYFTDFGDHCFYFSTAKHLMFHDNVIVANQKPGSGAGSTSFREIVKCRVAVDGYSIQGNTFNIPNGFFVEIGADDTSENSNILVSGNRGVCKTMVKAGQGDATSNLGSVSIIGNHAVTATYPILFGGFSVGVDLEELLIHDNYFESADPILLAGGATSVDTPAGDEFLDRSLGTISIRGNYMIFSAGSFVRSFGTTALLEIENNYIEFSGSAGTIITIDGLDKMAPQESNFRIKGNSIINGIQVMSGSDTAWGSISNLTYNLHFEGNKWTGSQLRIIYLSASLQSVYDGTITVKDTDLNLITQWSEAPNATFDLYAPDSKEVFVPITSAEVLALNATPKVLIPAVSGSYHVVETVQFFLDYNATAYAGANDIEIRIQNASGDKVCADIPVATLNNAGDSYYVCATPATPATPLISQPIIMLVGTANPTAGDSPVYVRVRYRTYKAEFWR